MRSSDGKSAAKTYRRSNLASRLLSTVTKDGSRANGRSDGLSTGCLNGDDSRGRDGGRGTLFPSQPCSSLCPRISLTPPVPVVAVVVAVPVATVVVVVSVVVETPSRKGIRQFLSLY